MYCIDVKLEIDTYYKKECIKNSFLLDAAEV